MPETISLFLKKRPSKRMGQNFLVDKRIAEKEVALAKVAGKNVLEIGPGLGALTIPLAGQAARVTAVEKDEQIAEQLKQEVAGFKNVQVIVGDFLEMEPGQADVIVSNVPYSISSKILFRLPLWKFDRALLCLQLEFAEKMVSEPGDPGRSRLSFSTQYYFKPKILGKISRHAFYPQPQVDSALVELQNKGRQFDKMLELVANALFQHKKKKSVNAIFDSRGMLGIPEEDFEGLEVPFSEKKVFELSEREIVEIGKSLAPKINLKDNAEKSS